MYRAWIAVAMFATACETGGGGGSVTVDAAPDATVIPVVELSQCPPTVEDTVVDTPTMFIPKETFISVGEVVKFTITAEHFVIPNTLTTTDDALRIGRGQTRCFRFNKVGVYGFLCGVHSFTGTITVQ